eukprot:1388866-Rhodomonas_salina.1
MNYAAALKVRGGQTPGSLVANLSKLHETISNLQMFLPVKEHCYSFGVCTSPTIIHNHAHLYQSTWNQPSETHSEQHAGTHLRQTFVLSTEIAALLDNVKCILGVLSNTDLARVVANGAIFECAGLLSMID